MSTYRIARGLRIFPYGQNIVDVVSAVMNKDRQDAAQKRQAVIRLADPRREAKKARGSAKSRRRLRNWPRPDPARRRKARRLSSLAEPSLPWAKLQKYGSCLHRGDALPTSTRTLAWRTILLVS
jgi:hypothetical protein